MKKTTIVFILSGILAVHAWAGPGNDRTRLRNAHSKGQFTFGGGIGIGGLQYPHGNDYLQFGEVTIEHSKLPYNVRADYGMTNDISIGAMINHFNARVEVKDNTDPQNKNGFDYKSTSVLLRASYHIYLGRNYVWLDPYATGMFGYHILNSIPFGDNNYFEPNQSGIAWSFQLGLNIYPFQNFGIYLEGGYGTNIANTGLVIRF
ncbi:MAG: hypothetical protein AB1458_03080 [Bacteroidota bacterium]